MFLMCATTAGRKDRQVCVFFLPFYFSIMVLNALFGSREML